MDDIGNAVLTLLDDQQKGAARRRVFMRRTPMVDALRAVIYIPTAEPNTDRWTLRAIEYVQRHGYQVTSVVHDWDNVNAMILTRDADVIVALRRDHPPADRVPRLEYVEDEEEGPAPAFPRGRRPRLTDG